MLVASLVAAAVVALALLVARARAGPALPAAATAAALAALKEATARSPGDVPLLAKVARMCFEQNDLEGAQRYFRSMLLQPLDENPYTKAEIFYYLAEVSQRRGDRAPARRLLQRALEADPALAPAQRLMADLTPRE